MERRAQERVDPEELARGIHSAGFAVSDGRIDMCACSFYEKAEEGKSATWRFSAVKIRSSAPDIRSTGASTALPAPPLVGAMERMARLALFFRPDEPPVDVVETFSVLRFAAPLARSIGFSAIAVFSDSRRHGPDFESRRGLGSTAVRPRRLACAAGMASNPNSARRHSAPAITCWCRDGAGCFDGKISAAVAATRRLIELADISWRERDSAVPIREDGELIEKPGAGRLPGVPCGRWLERRAASCFDRVGGFYERRCLVVASLEQRSVLWSAPADSPQPSGQAYD